jgi:hypothetical protein
MKNARILFLSAAFTAASAEVFAQVSAPKYSNEFLAIGVGARSLGMSNACVASVDDVTSGYWNPAGLLSVKTNMQIGLMHSEYFAGIAKYDYGALAYKIDSASTFGLSIIRFGVDDIPNTTDLIDAQGNVSYDRITTFSAADYGFLFSYARTPKIPNLKLGGNFKVIRRIVGDFGGAWGFGLDAGAQYDYKKWKLAAMVRDATSTFNAWSFTLDDRTKEVFQQTGNDIPDNSIELTLPKILLGGARKFDFKYNLSLLTELDMDLTFDGKRNVLIKSSPVSFDPHWGFELGYKNLVFLRGGIGNIQSELDVQNRKITTFQPNIGVGVHIRQFTIDYALTDIGDQSVALYSNVFSLKLDINRKPKPQTQGSM